MNIAGPLSYAPWGMVALLGALGVTLETFPPLRAAEPELEEVDLFEAGMSQVALYRIPGIVVTTRGSVLAYCEARKNGPQDWGEIEVQMRRSTDGGLYWESPVTIAHRGTRIEGNPRKPETGQHEQTVNNPVAIVDRATGHIHVLYCVNYARCFSMYSVDDGISFSEPIEITPIFEAFRSRYPWNVIATGPGHGIQTQGIQTQGIQTQPGRMIVPVWLAYGKAGDHAPSATGTIYSDDGGKTWQAGQIAVPNQGEFQNPNEAMLASLEDGRVMMVCRNVSKPNRKLITYSPTGIDQWTTPVFHTQLWEPICMASLSAYPSKPRCVLFSNPYSLALNPDGQEIPGGRGKRRNLTIQVSQDDGQTWPIRKVLCEGPSAYSDLAILPDGRILCLYENDRKITVARFNWEWLTSP